MSDVLNQYIERLIVEKAKFLDDAVFGYIQHIVAENGIDETRITLNEDAIVNALKKQIPQKPTMSRNVFRTEMIGAFPVCSICEKACFPGQKYCQGCGQKLDWRD